MSTATDLTAIVRDLNSRNCARIRRLEAEVQKNGLEIKRLRDIVRRLADIVRHDCDERAMAVTREAYAALGEEVPE